MKLDKNIKKEHIIFGIAMVIVTLFRIFLGANTLLILRENWVHDDGLVMNQVINILDGKWLGDWSGMTLIKGFVYPLFLAFCNKIRLSYPIALYTLYVVAVLLFFFAIKPLIKNKWIRFILYIFLLFSPVMFNYNTVQYIYRNAIIPAASILVIASFMGMFLRRKKNIGNFVVWLILSGISLSFFYFICENSIWLGIFAIGAVLITGIYIWKELDKKSKKLKILLLIIPFFALLLVHGIFSYINYQYYGTTALNSRTDTSFNDMMSKMILVERHEDDTNSSIWITHNMIEDMMEVSGTLKSIESYLDDAYKYWGYENGEIRGDFTQWVMIDAMERAGIYDSADSAEEFCKKVAEELETAFSNNTLQKTSVKQLYLSSTARGISLNDIPELGTRLGISLSTVITFEQAESVYTGSSGNYDKIIQLSEILDTDNIEMKRYISGWAFAKNDDVVLTAKILNSEQKILEEIVFEYSEDVNMQYNEYENSAMARFEVDLSGYDDDDFYIALYLDGEWYQTINASAGLNNDDIIVTIDNYLINTDLRGSVIAKVVQNISNSIIKVYQLLAGWIALVGGIGYVFITIKVFFNKNKEEKKILLQTWLIISGMFVCFMALLIGNCWYMSFYSGEIYRWRVFNYCVGGVVVFQIIEGLCIVKLLDVLKLRIRIINRFSKITPHNQ